VALDNDPAAVAAASANAGVNGVVIDVRRHDLRAGPVVVAPTVAANLVAPLLRVWAARLAQRAPESLRVIAGGVLVDEADSVIRAFEGGGLRETSRRSDGDWVALLLEAAT
jgi:ribosomal protein L11 methylase PrmA